MRPIQEGSLQSKESDSVGATETGALFPRLHVKETKVSGLRAPPRNKMALFEQFTIPPHRFVPPPVQLPSQTYPGGAFFYVPQGSHDGRYIYNPSYLNQAIPYNSQHQVVGQSILTQPMVANSSSSVVSSCDKEKHEAISGSSVVRTRACSSAVTSKARSFDKVGNRSMAKDPALARSQKKDLSCAHLSQSGAGSDFHQCGSSTDPLDSRPNIDCVQYFAAPSHKEMAWSPPTISMEAEKASLQASSTQAEAGVDNLKDRSPQVPGDGKVHDGRSLMFSAAKRTVQSALESLSIEGRVSSGLPVESCPPKCQSTVNLIGPPEGKHLSINDKENGATKTLADSDGSENDRFPNQNVEVNVSYSYFSVKTSERPSNADIRGLEETANVSLSNQLENNYCDTCMKSPSNRSSEESESSEPKDGSNPDQDSDSIVRSSDLTPKLIPKDVIDVFGQREFWKARSTIILQQKTFSGQVFELHRLIKVQQLIATMPSLLIEEDSESAHLNINVYEPVPAEGSENLGDNASPQLEEKISLKDKHFNNQPPEKSSKEQTSRHNNVHFQQCSVQHQQPGPAGAAYTRFFQGTFDTWGYPVASPTKIHSAKAVGEKPGPFVYETYLGTFSDPHVLSYGMVNNSVGNKTAPATVPSLVPQGIPVDKLGQTNIPLIGPNQLTNPAVLSEEISANKGISHSSAVWPGSAASGSGSLPRSDWSRPVLNNLSSHSKDNKYVRKYQWLNSSPGEKQPRETKKQRFQTGASTQAVCGSEEKGLVEFSGPCTLQSDCMVLGESNAQQNDPRHANSIFTSTILTQDYGSLKIGHTDEATEPVFCHEGNFRVPGSSALHLFPLAPVLCPGKGSDKPSESDHLQVSKVIKAVPRSAVAASESTAIILKSIQQERWQQG